MTERLSTALLQSIAEDTEAPPSQAQQMAAELVLLRGVLIRHASYARLLERKMIKGQAPPEQEVRDLLVFLQESETLAE